ncbi:hypothetical protein PIN31115_02074 [Pandoraea iniqua]|uniref:Uncharacterized protein n=1 Tax=Pandoraea iniqua TaxID=2508288 RepID=A0A5E4UKJ2_9BURK|nr:hypothetical protein [Pandoraea iniqua]VVE00412.1 hypothetical protein PIN31115_02074 [Pandoraea iniqua]
MSKLSSAKRDALPAKQFAGPDRSYPVPDASHAANAKARATQAVDAGRMSGAEKAKIDAKANKVLGKKPARGERTAKNKATRDPKKTGQRLATWMA